MRKRILTWTAAGVLGAGAALGIAACGDDDDTEIAPVEIDDTTQTTGTTATTGTTDTKDTGGVGAPKGSQPGGGGSGGGGVGY